MSAFPPGLLLLLGSLLLPLLRGRARAVWLLLLPLLSLTQTLSLDLGSHLTWTLGGYEVELLRVDRLSLIFAYVFHLALFVGNLYALHVEENTQHTAANIYGAGTIGAVFCGDMISLFVFWELVAVASTFLIWARRSERSYGAGLRYLAVQLVSGLLLLAGAMVRYRATGSLSFDHVGLDGAGGTLLLAAFGIKSAFPFVHTWLTDAYPEATPTGAVYLSAFTSKLAVYALARSFAGEEALIWIGCAMAAFPIFYAVIENDMRRVLAYSLINQVGFMVVGVGFGGEYGLNGACAHAFADVLFKGLLFMTMGAVLHRTGEIRASKLGGLYKTMPFTAVCCLVGAASISAFPLFSAFATKSLVMEAVAHGDERFRFAWFVLLFAAAGVFHHAGIKIPFFAFFGHDSGLRPKPAPANMRAAMGLSALLCIVLGTFPHLLYELLPVDGLHYVPYTVTHVITQLQLLFFSALAFTALMLTGRYPPELPSVNLDADWTWRRGLRLSFRLLTGPLGRLAAQIQTTVLERLPRLAARSVEAEGPLSPLLHRRYDVGGGVLIFLVVLLALLVAGGVHG